MMSIKDITIVITSFKSENKIKEYESLINNSKDEARNYFNEARKKIIKDINKKRVKVE